MAAEQLPLLPEQETPSGDEPSPITARSSLHRAIAAFAEYMPRIDLAENTIKAFLWDLSLLERYLGPQVEIGSIGTAELRAFMEYLRHGRGVRCTPKSYGRRLTTLKVFFDWLATSRVLPHDPAAPLVHEPAPSPLPLVLHDEQVEWALEAARTLLADARKPDPRPLLLLSLILQTGMKKSECLALELAHLDLSDQAAPAAFIRYRNPKRLHKERRLALDRSFPGLLRRYLEVYKPRQKLFPCTGRNLEYVLQRVAKLAGLEGGITFEMLRWTCAVRDYQAGMEPDRLRRKLGLSAMSWQEMEPRLQALIASPL